MATSIAVAILTFIFVKLKFYNFKTLRPNFFICSFDLFFVYLGLLPLDRFAQKFPNALKALNFSNIKNDKFLKSFSKLTDLNLKFASPNCSNLKMKGS